MQFTTDQSIFNGPDTSNFQDSPNKMSTQNYDNLLNFSPQRVKIQPELT